MILSTHGILASQIPSASLLLDLYPSAAAAYSVRLLRTLYTGNAIRVRRSSDNAEQNIGFTALGNLDTSALTSFCGSGNGFVTTWYDQSGNANNAVQTTAANQPKIVNSGSVINVNSKPCLEFTNSAVNSFVFSPFFTYTGDSTIFHVAKNRSTALNNYGTVISQGGGTVNQAIGVQMQLYPGATSSATVDIYAPGGVTSLPIDSTNVQYLTAIRWQNWSTFKTNGNTIIAVNGTNKTLSSYGATSTGLSTANARIGTFDTTSAGSFLGEIQEIVVYTTGFTQLSIDGAENNINTYYAIY